MTNTASADEAIADFEASKTLARAREAVELAVANRNCEGHVSPEIAQDSEDMLKARKETERGWQRAMDKIAERASQTKRSRSAAVTPSPLGSAFY
jgi:adenine-specific DNA methylase